MKRVAIVGGGACGIVMLKSILEQKWDVEVMLFESSDCIGGTWVYNSDAKDNNQTAMYENLRTNLPKDCMGFLNHPFPSKLPTFISHEDVLKYLEDYATQYNLNSYIHLNCKVSNISPVDINNPHVNSWKVSWESNNGDKRTENTDEFDYVAICNGHYNTPFIPDIPGISHFKGQVMHSSSYRNNTPFIGKKIVIIGNGASAADIGLELAEVASVIHHCKRAESVAMFSSPTCSNVISHCNVTSVNDKGEFIVEDDNTLSDIDILMYCTGFHYDYPFLSEECKIHLKYKRVCDLLFHIFPINENHPQYSSNTDEKTTPPTIAFIGIPWKILPFPLFDVQARYVAAIWSGKSSLPSMKEIKEIFDQEASFHEKAGLPEHYLHCLGLSQFNYCSKLLSTAGHNSLLPNLEENKKIALVTKYVRDTNPDDYKDFKLIHSKGKWKYVKDE